MKPSASLLLLLLSLLSSCAARPFADDLKAELIEEVGEVLVDQGYADGVDFGRWPVIAAEHRSALAAAVAPASFEGAMNAALAEFRVSHLGLMSPETARHRFAGTDAGIGAKSVVVEDGLVITHVIGGGPAARAGLRRGDVVVAVDGTRPERRGALGGAEGTALRLRLRRRDDPVDVEVTPGPSPRADQASLRWLEGNVAWLAVQTFISEIYDEDRVESLFVEASGADGLVLDLRSNGGGNSDHVHHLLSRLLPAGTKLDADVYAEDVPDYLAANPGAPTDAVSMVRWLDRYWLAEPGPIHRSPYEGPVVVLIDGRCGSGGDVVPAVLRETGRARMIGTATLGQVRAGEKVELTGGWFLHLPVGELVTPRDRILEGHPVEPDVRLTPRQAADDEVILPLALDLLVRGGVTTRFRIENRIRS